MAQYQQPKKDLITACRLYSNKGKNGKYMAGNLGALRVLIFPIPKEKQEESGGATARLVFGQRDFSDNKNNNGGDNRRNNYNKQQQPPPQQQAPPIDDDDLPF